MNPLPATATEIRAIYQLLKEKGIQADTFMGAAATEGVVKRANNPLVLELPTHGSVLDASVPEPALPLLRAILYFAGSADSVIYDSNDGKLTAYEAQLLRLDSTELVALTECKSGLGTVVNGEGIYGLPRSFMVAGARQVLMSLWEINDAVAAEYAILFYKNWLGNGDARSSLQAAQKIMREKYKHPSLWGMFVLVQN